MEATRKHSKKRDAILGCLSGTTSHPSAEWVYAQLKPQIPDLSLATVYRNIKLFCEEGALQSVGVINGLERYDANTAPHVHFVCTACGAVLDVPQLEIPDTLAAQAAAQLGGEVHSSQLSFRGVCKNCV